MRGVTIALRIRQLEVEMTQLSCRNMANRRKTKAADKPSACNHDEDEEERRKNEEMLEDLEARLEELAARQGETDERVEVLEEDAEDYRECKGGMACVWEAINTLQEQVACFPGCAA